MSRICHICRIDTHMGKKYWLGISGIRGLLARCGCCGKTWKRSLIIAPIEFNNKSEKNKVDFRFIG